MSNTEGEGNPSREEALASEGTAVSKPANDNEDNQGLESIQAGTISVMNTL